MSTLPEAAAVPARAAARVPGPRSGARRPLPQPPVRLDPGPLRRRIRRAAYGPWLLAAVFATLYGADSVHRYTQFRTTSWDLALFTEAVKQYAHLHAPIADARAPGFDLLGEHFHPILALLAPLFAIKPSPVTLLLAQALLFASSIVPVTSLARERLGARSGYVVGAAYGASFGIVQAVDFDFHELAFAAPLIALALLALLRDRSRLLILACVGLLCTNEVFGITVVLPLGIAWALRDRTRWRRRLPLAALGLLVSLAQILWVIPALNPNHVYGFLTDTGTAGSGQPATGQQGQYAPSALHIQALRAAIHEVPAGTSVESGISTLAPLAAKADAYWSGNAEIDPAPEYVVYDTTAEQAPLTPDQVVQLVEAWHPLAVYDLVSAQDGVDVLHLS